MTNLRVPLFVVTCGMVCVVLVISSLTIGLSYDSYSKKAISDGADRYISMLSQNVHVHTRGYLRVAARTLDKYSTQMGFDNTSYTSTTFHRNELLQYMTSLPPYYEKVFFAAAEDSLWYSMTGPSFQPTGVTFTVSTCVNYIHLNNFSYKQSAWKCAPPVSGSLNNNATARPWYQLVVAGTKNKKLWAVDSANARYTLATGVWRRDKFLGVCGIDVTSAQLSEFLSLLVVQDGTLVFITDQHAVMVATNQMGAALSWFDRPTTLDKWPYQKRVRQLYAAMGNSDTNGVTSLTLNGEPHFVMAGPVDASGQERIEWRIFIAVPAASFLAEVSEGQFRVTLAMVFGSLSAMLVSVGISFLISAPFKTLQADMAAVAVMDLEGVSDSTTVISEISDMRLSFTQMVGKIKEFRAFMPQAILTNQMEHDENVPEQDANPNTTPESLSIIPTMVPPHRAVRPGLVLSPLRLDLKNSETDSIPELRTPIRASPRQPPQSERNVVVLTLREDIPSSEMSTVFIARVGTIVRETHGIIHSYRAGQFIATWTKTNLVGRPHVNALRAAVTATQSLLSDHNITCYAGIDASMCFTGVVGSSAIIMCNELRGDAAVGSPSLALLGRVMKAQLLISETVSKAGYAACTMRFVGHAPFQDPMAFRANSKMIPEQTLPKVFEVLDLRSSEKDKGTASGDEWMYLIEKEERVMEAMAIFETAVGHFTSGRKEEALKIFKDVAEKNPLDGVAAQFIQMCTENEK